MESSAEGTQIAWFSSPEAYEAAADPLGEMWLTASSSVRMIIDRRRRLPHKLIVKSDGIQLVLLSTMVEAPAANADIEAWEQALSNAMQELAATPAATPKWGRASCLV